MRYVDLKIKTVRYIYASSVVPCWLDGRQTDSNKTTIMTHPLRARRKSACNAMSLLSVIWCDSTGLSRVCATDTHDCWSIMCGVPFTTFGRLPQHLRHWFSRLFIYCLSNAMHGIGQNTPCCKKWTTQLMAIILSKPNRLSNFFDRWKEQYPQQNRQVKYRALFYQILVAHIIIVIEKNYIKDLTMQAQYEQMVSFDRWVVTRRLLRVRRGGVMWQRHARLRAGLITASDCGQLCLTQRN